MAHLAFRTKLVAAVVALVCDDVELSRLRSFFRSSVCQDEVHSEDENVWGIAGFVVIAADCVRFFLECCAIWVHPGWEGFSGPSLIISNKLRVLHPSESLARCGGQVLGGGGRQPVSRFPFPFVVVRCALCV